MNILDEILKVKKEEVKNLRKEYSLSRFQDSEHFEKPKLNLTEMLNNNFNISIIAEIKKASPSKGILKEDFNHLEIAEQYMENEVDAISILTDKNFFQGSIKFLNDIAKIKTVPLLRKDFIIDEYQVYEAKSSGADAILLIAEALSANQISELTHAAYETDMDVLLELHSGDQIKKMNFELNKLIGINNRDLNDFSVSLDTTLVISENLPEDITLVSESGIQGEKELDILKDSRTNAVLVGEHFMKAENISDEIKKFKEGCIRES